MELLFFGGSGFLGRSVGEKLAESGWRVTRATRENREHPNLFSYSAEPKSLRKLLARKKFDAVLNFAAGGLDSTNNLSRQDWEVNSHFPAMLAAAIKESSPETFFLHFASALELRSEVSKLSHYARSKKMGTELLLDSTQASSVKLGLLFLNSVYGPNQPQQRFVARATSVLRSRKVLYLNNPLEVREFLFIDDVCTWISKLLLEPKAAFIAEVRSENPITIESAAETIAELVGAPTSLIRTSSTVEQAREPRRNGSGEFLGMDQLMCPTSFKVGLALTLEATGSV